MNKNESMLIDILSLAIRGKKMNTAKIKKIKWDKVLKEATAHDVQALLYIPLKDLPPSSDSWKEFRNVLKMITMQTTVWFMQHNNDISKVLQGLKEAGIPVVAFKGIVLKDLYPRPELRTMGDTDLIVPKEYLNQSRKIIEQLGYYEDGPDEKCIHFAHKDCFSIELHWKLLNNGNFKNEMDGFEKEIWNNIIPAKVCGVEIYTLGVIDHLLHLCMHMAFHILNGGFGLRQLCDFVLYTESVSDTINWKELLSRSEELRIDCFMSAMFEVANQLFRLETPLYKSKYKHKQKVIKSLIFEILISGTFGHRLYKWKRISNFFHNISPKTIKTLLKPTNLVKSIPTFFIEIYFKVQSILIVSKRRKKLFKSLNLV